MRKWVVARISPGGVGRNIAACLGLLGAPVRLVSAATISSTHTVRPDLADAMATFEPPTPREVTDVDDHL